MMKTDVAKALARGNIKKTLPNSFLDKGGGHWLDPPVGRPCWSTDQWVKPPTFSFGEKLSGGFLKEVQGATHAESRTNCR